MSIIIEKFQNFVIFGKTFIHDESHLNAKLWVKKTEQESVVSNIKVA